MGSPLNLTVREQVARMARGGLRAEALMEAVLERVAAVNGPYHAIVSMALGDSLLARARELDLRVQRDGPQGPLSGVPTAIKDLADVAGFPTSQGSPIFAGSMAVADDPHVAHMRAAGALFIGKTNTPEFGLGGHTYNPVHGATGNPYDPDRSCGGSSGGAAVALALGCLGVADGSDMMGSLRTPAGWCNVYGMRPTRGLVPGPAGGDLYLHRLSTRGPMARCPSDLSLLLDVMAGREGGELVPDARAVRIGWLADWGGAYPMDSGILAKCEDALGTFAGLGCSVTPMAPPVSAALLWDSWTTLRAFTLAAEMRGLLADPVTAPQLKPEAVWEIEKGRALSAMEVHEASVLRSDWYRAAMAAFERCDVLVLPSAQLWPFALDLDWPKSVAGQQMDTYHRWMEVTIPASLIGLPVVSVPAGFGPEGLPIGIQLIGKPGSDAMLLRLAEAYHRATDWPSARPALPI